MVKVTSISYRKEPKSQKDLGELVYKNVGQASFFLKDEVMYIQHENIHSMSPPKETKRGYLYGESCLYEEENNDLFMKKIINRNLPPSRAARYVFWEEDGFPAEAAKVCSIVDNFKNKKISFGIWYFDQIVFEGGTEPYIAGDIYPIEAPQFMDLVKVASFVGKARVIEFLTKQKINKQKIDLFNKSFESVAFYLGCLVMDDISRTEDVQSATTKAYELNDLVNIMGPEAKSVFSTVVDFWLKDSQYKTEWKEIILK